MASEKDIEKGMASLRKNTALNGIGSLLVDDGQIFMFNKEFIQGLLVKMGDQEEIVLFVQRGPSVHDTPDEGQN